MEFNKYSMYSIGTQYSSVSKTDEVDDYIAELRDLDEYEDAKKFVQDHFGTVEGVKFFEFPELSKSVSVVLDEEKVEICALKNNRQYYGKGWKLISKNE